MNGTNAINSGRVVWCLVPCLVASGALLAGPPPVAGEALRASVAVRDITPDTQRIPTPLGGYGARENRPALGVHDATLAKALVLRQGERKLALVTLDLQGIPRSLREEVQARTAAAGYSVANLVLAASHTHASVEMNAMERRNVFANRFIGIFDQRLLEFTAARIAEAILAADAVEEPVRAGASATSVHGLSHNRRGDGVTDDALTVLRLDRQDGRALAVLVNFTAHPTWTTERTMHVSGDWPGYLQREVEAWLGDGVVCLFTNGAEGDTAPAGGEGPSEFARAEDHGRKLAVHAVALARRITTAGEAPLRFAAGTYRLPERTAPPALLESAGPEYGLNEDNITTLIDAMVPIDAPWHALRIGDLVAVTIPGEMTAGLGLEIKSALRSAGAGIPVIFGLSPEWLSYFLPPEEFHQGGYEPGVSFYGESAGPQMVRQAIAAGRSVLP